VKSQEISPGPGVAGNVPRGNQDVEDRANGFDDVVRGWLDRMTRFNSLPLELE
jgi:hypothetical protein